MSNLADLIGMNRERVDDFGQISVVHTSLAFYDDDPLSVYIEPITGRIRFFDEGVVTLHMLGSGIDLRNAQQLRAITALAESEGLVLNDEGELEMWAEVDGIASAFTHYVAGLEALLRWEGEEVERMSGNGLSTG